MQAQSAVPGISVIIPCFNAAATLARALESCIAQPQAAQIIVVDDGSTDASQQIAAHYAARSPRVTLLALNQNAGAARARNWGALHADHDVLAFLDADDEYLPGALDMAAGYLARHPEQPSIRLNVEFCGFPERIATHPDFERFGDMLTSTVPSSLVIRRAIFLALGGFPGDALFRRAGGEDMPLSKALFQRFGNRRLTGDKAVRMHFHPHIHAQRFFLINMRFIDDPQPELTAEVFAQQMRIVERSVAAIDELNCIFKAHFGETRDTK